MTANDKTTQERVFKIIAQQFDSRFEISEDTRLEDLDADEVDEADIRIAINEAFGKSFGRLDIEELETAQDWVRLVERS